MLPMSTDNIKENIMSALNQSLEYLKKYKLIVVIVTVGWLVLSITIGVISGLNNKVEYTALSAEDENAAITEEVNRNISQVEDGEMLTTKNNLSLFQIEQSKNYVENLNNKGK